MAVRYVTGRPSAGRSSRRATRSGVACSGSWQRVSKRPVPARAADDAGVPPLRVLRVCSVFEAPDAALAGRGARFDPVGGMQSHTVGLTRALDRLGVRQVVLTHRPPGAPRSERLGDHADVRRFGLPMHWMRQLYSGPAAVAALRLARTTDVVHAHVGEDLAVLPIARTAARRASVPLVVTVHCSLRHTFRGTGLRASLLRVAGGALEVAAYRRADAVIALTPRLAALVADLVPRDRLHVIPSGVDAAAFAGDPPDPFPDAGRPRVVYAGRLIRQKGVHTLVDAAARSRTPGLCVLLVGDGPERRSLERAIRWRGLGGRVRITGFVPHREIPAVLRHADLLCLPSHYEELGSVLVEGMQAGVPIVASETGGIPDAVGPAARLVAPGDAAALAVALDALLEDRAEAARLAALGAERARAWDWDCLARRVLDVYRLVRHPAEPLPAESTTAVPAPTGTG
jgi:glycogen synthase